MYSFAQVSLVHSNNEHGVKWCVFQFVCVLYSTPHDGAIGCESVAQRVSSTFVEIQKQGREPNTGAGM